MNYRPRCPYCGGPANSMQLLQAFSTPEKLVYAVECWSGDTNRFGPYHHFTATIRVLKGSVEIDLLKMAEARIVELEKELANSELRGTTK
jgi:hypothetical protein